MFIHVYYNWMRGLNCVLHLYGNLTSMSVITFHEQIMLLNNVGTIVFRSYVTIHSRLSEKIHTSTNSFKKHKSFNRIYPQLLSRNVI